MVKLLFLFFYISSILINTITSSSQDARPHSIMLSSTDNNFFCQATLRALSAEESRDALGTYIDRGKGDLFLLELNNDSPHHYVLMPSSFSTSPATVTEWRHFFDKKRLGTQLVGSAVGSLAPPLFLASVLFSLHNHIHHKRLEANFLSKTIPVEGELILPFSQTSRLVLFAKEEGVSSARNIEITLVDSDNGQTTILVVKPSKERAWLEALLDDEDQEITAPATPLSISSN